MIQAPKTATTVYLLTNIYVKPNCWLTLCSWFEPARKWHCSPHSLNGRQGALPWSEGWPVCGHGCLAFHIEGDGRATSMWLWLFGRAVPSPAFAFMNITLLNINHISALTGRLSDHLRALTAPVIIQFILPLFCSIWPTSNSLSGEAQRAGLTTTPRACRRVPQGCWAHQRRTISVTIRTPKPNHPLPGSPSWAPKTLSPFHAVHGAPNLRSKNPHPDAGS